MEKQFNPDGFIPEHGGYGRLITYCGSQHGFGHFERDRNKTHPCYYLLVFTINKDFRERISSGRWTS